MSARRPALSETVEWKLWKTRRRDIAIVGSLSTYQETNIFGLREHVVGSDGIMRPTTRGIAMAVKRLPEVADTVNKMLAKARELGLLDDKSEAET
jgi:hypothetical protein